MYREVQDEAIPNRQRQIDTHTCSTQRCVGDLNQEARTQHISTTPGEASAHERQKGPKHEEARRLSTFIMNTIHEDRRLSIRDRAWRDRAAAERARPGQTQTGSRAGIPQERTRGQRCRCFLQCLGKRQEEQKLPASALRVCSISSL